MLLGAFVTALWGLSRPGNQTSKSKSLVNTSMYESKFPKLQPWVSCFTGECDVMVNELAPDDQQNRYSMVMEAFILVGTFHATYIGQRVKSWINRDSPCEHEQRRHEGLEEGVQ